MTMHDDQTNQTAPQQQTAPAQEHPYKNMDTDQIMRMYALKEEMSLRVVSTYSELFKTLTTALDKKVGMETPQRKMVLNLITGSLTAISNEIVQYIQPLESQKPKTSPKPPASPVNVDNESAVTVTATEPDPEGVITTPTEAAQPVNVSL